MEHRLTIAARAGIGEEVADALIETGEENVIEALLRNGDAHLSMRAREYLVEESRRVDRYQEPLLGRPDLPPTLACRMFWWVSAALRLQILNSYQIDEAELDEIIQASARSIQAETAATEDRRTEAEKLVADLADRGELTEQFLLQALRQKSISTFIVGFARMAGLNQRMARRIVFDPGGEALMATCKAIGMDRAIFASVNMLTRRALENGPTAPSRIDRMLRVYDRLPQEKARHVLRFWQRDVAYIEAISQVAPDDD
jgi:uncharacterized protein (DUF2336 family)